VGKKAVKLIPGVGTIAAIFVFGGEVYAGRPIGEALLDNAIDAIPFVGTVKGGVEIIDAGVAVGTVLLTDSEVEVDEEEVDDALWEAIDDFPVDEAIPVELDEIPM